jgi:hypothetical protein
MRFVRTILALVIALSVAVLPAAGSATRVMSSKTSDIAEIASAKIAKMADMAIPAKISMATRDRCPNPAKAKPGDCSREQCLIASCAAQVLFIAYDARLNSLILAGSPLPFPRDQAVSLRSGALPFRPPRV